MTDIVVIQEPLLCPLCNTAGRVGFLRKILNGDEAQFIIGGKQIEYRCNTCEALFGVEESDL